MPISFDDHVSGVVFLGVIGLIFSLFLAGITAESIRGVVRGTVILWLIGYGLVTWIAIGVSQNQRSSPPDDQPLSNTQAAAELGLKSGESYPLLLGSRTSGSAGTTDVTTSVRAGIFSARATTSMQSSTTPASAVSLGYTTDGKTYILEMPTSHITFVQSATAEPSVTLWLNDEESFDFGKRVYSGTPPTDCQWTFNNLLVMCLWPEYTNVEPTIVVDKQARDVGLGPIVTAGFVRAEIVLTPKMYRQLLGIIE